MKNNNIKHILLALLGLIIVNVISSYVHKRFDLTKDKRYTLSNNSKSIIDSIEDPLIIDVFLVGDFPSEFRFLQNEVKYLIEEFQLQNNNIKVNFINPIEDEATRERNISELSKSGLEPFINTNSETGKITQDIIFPWAFASYNNKTVKIPLLKRSITEDLKTQINNSTENLEYAFIDAFNQILKDDYKTIAILKGNGELKDAYIADFLKTIKPYYKIAPFTLDSVQNNPIKTLNNLKQYDLIVAAKPTEPFSEKEKLVLDQYTMNGGKSLWLTESVIMDKDSLYNASGASVSVLRDLNLNDFFFKYGIRINPSLVKDLYSSPIMLAIGEGSNAQLQPLQWQYSPLAAANPNHVISKNIDLVRFDFASPIDTLKNPLKQQILLQSSPNSKLEGVPTTISLSDVTKQPDEESYNKPPQNLGVLIEGEFTSVYDKRILPFKIKNYKSKSATTKMVVISDGDVIKNKVIRNKPQQLGFDEVTGKSFGNKEFLLNTVNYLLDDSGIINLRNKELQIPFLNQKEIEENKSFWQIINVILPLIILILFGIVFHNYRKHKFSK